MDKPVGMSLRCLGLNNGQTCGDVIKGAFGTEQWTNLFVMKMHGTEQWTNLWGCH